MDKKIKFIYLIQGNIHFTFGLLGPIYAVFVKNIGGDLLSAGLTYGVYMLSMGLGYILFGKIEDFLRIRALATFLGLFIQTFCIFSYILVSSPLQLFIIQIFLGLAGAIRVPAMDALMSELTEKKKEATLWGILEAVEDISYGIAAIIGGAIVYCFGFQILFLGMGLLSLIATFSTLALFTKKERQLLKFFLKTKFS